MGRFEDDFGRQDDSARPRNPSHFREDLLALRVGVEIKDPVDEGDVEGLVLKRKPLGIGLAMDDFWGQAGFSYRSTVAFQHRGLKSMA